MSKKKTVNEAAIKKRYLLNEKPKDIGPDFGLTAKQVSDLAQRRGWKRKKEEISVKVETFVEDDLKRQMSKVSSLFERMLLNIENDLANMGATIQDGEGFPNKYHQISWEKGLAKYLGTEPGKQDEAQILPPEDVDPIDAIERIKGITRE